MSNNSTEILFNNDAANDEVSNLPSVALAGFDVECEAQVTIDSALVRAEAASHSWLSA